MKGLGSSGAFRLIKSPSSEWPDMVILGYISIMSDACDKHLIWNLNANLAIFCWVFSSFICSFLYLFLQVPIWWCDSDVEHVTPANICWYRSLQTLCSPASEITIRHSSVLWRDFPVRDIIVFKVKCVDYKRSQQCQKLRRLDGPLWLL